jgi:hypothetical protein
MTAKVVPICVAIAFTSVVGAVFAGASQAGERGCYETSDPTGSKKGTVTDCSQTKAAPQNNATAPPAPAVSNVPATAAVAQSKAVKKDILGFFPGMSKEEFDARAAQSLQSDGLLGGLAAGSQSKQWGGVTRTLTEKLDRNLVKEVGFRFSSGIPPQEMITSISDQYGANPIKPNWSVEINNAQRSQRYEYYLTLSSQAHTTGTIFPSRRPSAMRRATVVHAFCLLGIRWGPADRPNSSSARECLIV